MTITVTGLTNMEFFIFSESVSCQLDNVLGIQDDFQQAIRGDENAEASVKMNCTQEMADVARDYFTRLFSTIKGTPTVPEVIGALG